MPALVALGTLTALATARADVEWLLPERFDPPAGAILAIDLVAASEFGASEPTAVAPTSLECAGSLAAGPIVFTPTSLWGEKLRVLARLPRPGVGVIRVDLPALRREIPANEVERYLRRIYASDDIRAAWEAGGARTWSETYQCRFKTFLTVGEPPAGDQSWMTPAIAGLDLVAQETPNLLRDNNKLTVQVFRDGQPLPGATVSFLSWGANREHVVIADESGRVSAKLDAKGLWLVQTTLIESNANASPVWKTRSIVLTVEAH